MTKEELIRSIWHNPDDIPEGKRAVLFIFRGRINKGSTNVEDSGNYSIVENNNYRATYWKSEISGWCYCDDLLPMDN